MDLAAIPLDEDAYRWAATGGGATPLDHALSDGEDFELILAAGPDEAQRLLDDQPLETPLTRIGACTAEPGLWARDVAGGPLRRMEPRGWRH